MTTARIRELLAKAPTPEAPVRVEQCLCGHPACTTHSITEGNFYQGSGWNKPTAELYATLRNEIGPLLDRVERLEKAVIDMVHDGWLQHGVEGMTEIQQFVYDTYCEIPEVKAALRGEGE